jgi:hypothetical protein
MKSILNFAGAEVTRLKLKVVRAVRDSSRRLLHSLKKTVAANVNSLILKTSEPTHIGCYEPRKQEKLPFLTVFSHFSLKLSFFIHGLGSVRRRLNPVGDELNPVRQGLNPLRHGLNPVSHRLNPVGRELNPVHRGLNPIRHELNPVGDGLEPVHRKLNPFSDELNPVRRGLNLNFNRQDAKSAKMKILIESKIQLPLRPSRGERAGVRWVAGVEISKPLTPALSPLCGARGLFPGDCVR